MLAMALQVLLPRGGCLSRLRDLLRPTTRKRELVSIRSVGLYYWDETCTSSQKLKPVPPTIRSSAKISRQRAPSPCFLALLAAEVRISLDFSVYGVVVMAH
jgi:hypothetical protein